LRVEENHGAARDDETFLTIADVKKLNPARLLLFKLLQEYGFNETTVDDLLFRFWTSTQAEYLNQRGFCWCLIATDYHQAKNKGGSAEAV
jgi:hypothetical protein